MMIPWIVPVALADCRSAGRDPGARPHPLRGTLTWLTV
jgi:hypothetical protein